MQTPLAQVRKTSRMTQVEAACKLGVSQPFLSQLERGDRGMSEEVAKRAYEVFGDPTFLTPQTDRHQTDAELADELGAMGYPGFAYRGGQPSRNPAEVLLDALDRPELETRVVEGLPWLPLRYSHLDWKWLTREMKLRNRQNRLGFVVTLAKQLADRMPEYHEVSPFLSSVEKELEDARLAKVDTLCHETWSNRRLEQVNRQRSRIAEHWNLSTGVSVEHLAHYGA
jgi:transcriptional regulator with XRE-family HTH domain